MAERLGLKPYTFLNVELYDESDARTGAYLGWYIVTLAVGDYIFGFLETGLCHDIARGVLSERVSRPEYFVAGSIPDKEVDFVFNNVGHLTARIRSACPAVSANAPKKRCVIVSAALAVSLSQAGILI